jgi:hypothetical protein
MRRVGVVESKFGLESSSVRSSGTAFNKSLHENEDNKPQLRKSVFVGKQEKVKIIESIQPMVAVLLLALLLFSVFCPALSNPYKTLGGS